jgi:hypothetical protein
VSRYNQQVDRQNAARRRAINEYNARARKANQTIDQYNREARAHNARVRTARARLQQEVRRLESARTSASTRVTYRTSVTALTDSFSRLDQRAAEEGWRDSEFFAMSEGEAANGVAALNELLDDRAGATATDEEVDDLRSTEITNELAGLDSDLDARWRGALFALHPENPDAARHFCTSARELIADMLNLIAPASEVEAAEPECERTPQGSVSRRSRIRFSLRRCGLQQQELEDFIEADVENVLALFSEFNTGTHGSAGRFTLGQLRSLKTRVEDAIQFIVRLRP